MRLLTTPNPLSQQDLDGAQRIREHLKRRGIEVPADLESPFFLARWWNLHDGDMEKIVSLLENYFTHRQLHGYDRMTAKEILEQLPFAKSTFEKFSVSTLEGADTARSGDIFVFVQKMCGCNLKDITAVMPLSHVLDSYFCMQDLFSRTICARERETGRQSSFVCILDLEGLNLSDFLNPLGAPTQLARLVVSIWSNYFADNLVKLLIVNPPAVLSVLWRVTKCIMDERTQKRVAFLVEHRQLRDHLEPDAIPACYGGGWSDRSGWSAQPEDCVRPLIPVTSPTKFDAAQLWKAHGLSQTPDKKSLTLKGQQVSEVKLYVQEGDRILWQWTSNGDVVFDVTREENAEFQHVVRPKLTLTSLKVPESGALKCSQAGTHVLRFQNPVSSWFPLKVQVTAVVIPATSQ